MNQPTTTLLNRINSPADLRALSVEELPALANELRAFILNSVSATGGHLSSNLGTVELTVALHYVFNTPDDRVVWDVGHQTYAHKILTGRREWMSRLRMKDGPSGFPRRSESAFDAFGTAHSSTSISAALGMAEASRILGNNRLSIAIIGDGALSGGMAFEAMNNAGISKTNMLVILNDNEMSISPAVGALHKYLVRLLSSSMYRAAWRVGEKWLGAQSGLIELARRAEEHLKGMIAPSTLFEELGFNYLGPIDGHDLPLLLGTLSAIKNNMVENGDKAISKGINSLRPQFLHIVTKKGQGYKLAEKDPVLYHGVAKFDAKMGLSGNDKVAVTPTPTYTEVFSEWLCDMGAIDKRLVAITPAMREGSGLVKFAEDYPERYFDVGIAEQHAVTFAGGIACEGLKPVVAIYSTFLQRAYDQLIHDVALQNLPMLFAIDRAGLVGADGATHAGSFDLSFLTCLPNMVVMTPSNENECRQMLYTGFMHEGPVAVRYPRGKGPGVAIQKAMEIIPMGQSVKVREGKTFALLAFGAMVTPATVAGDTLNATVINMRFVKPIDANAIVSVARLHAGIITLEENTVIGGAGSEVARVLSEAGIMKPILHIGLPDRFVDHADAKEQLQECKMDVESIIERIREWAEKLNG